MPAPGTNPMVCLWNAPLDTGNLGVQALSLSVIAGIRRRLPDTGICVFGSKPGVHREQVRIGEDLIEVWNVGASLSRNPLKPGNLHRESIGVQLLGHRWPGAVTRMLTASRLAMDITGGDSFTTLYGDRRYEYVNMPKRLTLRLGVPLVLMPQTYGPFDDHRRPEVIQFLRSASMVWARDERSRSIADQLMGSPQTRISCDVAFTLPARIDPALAIERGTGAVIGVNVSGLLGNESDDTVRAAYGFRVSYFETVRLLLQRLLEADASALVYLVPHVVVPREHPENDAKACERVLSSLPSELRSRVRVTPEPADAGAAKGMIAGFDFFIGTRMHACIAALSSGVPAGAIAYSDKTRGVFETVGLGEQVADPRSTDKPEEIVDRLLLAFGRRDAARATLVSRLPEAVESVNRMFDEVASLASASEEIAC